MMAGIVLVLVPLLALTADQMKAVKEADSRYASLEAHHMYEIPTSTEQAVESIIARMKAISGESSSTMFLFCSPQYITKNPDFLEAIL